MLQKRKYFMCMCVFVCMCVWCVCVWLCGVCVCVFLSICVLVCITKSKVFVKEMTVISTQIFQFTSVPLGCAIYQAFLMVHVSVSVDGAELQTVSTAF